MHDRNNDNNEKEPLLDKLTNLKWSNGYFAVIFILLITVLYVSYQQLGVNVRAPSTPHPHLLKSIHSNECLPFLSQNLSSNKNIIYDFFIFNNEFDLLEIRLYELYDYVTLFLIAESNVMLSGKAKPLYLKENWHRFSQYHQKMRRIEVKLTSRVENAKLHSWDNEHRMRNEGIRLSVPNSTIEFILMTSDIDEIPKARYVRALQSCQLTDQFKPTLFQCDFYYYSFEFLQPVSPRWPGASVSRFKVNETVPSDIRDARLHYHPIPGSCNHCSYCFDTVASVRLKLSSFSHTEVDIDRFRNLSHITDRFRNGADLFDVVGSFKRVNTNESDIPRLLQREEGRRRFQYLLERSSMPNIGFIDLEQQT